MNGSNEMKVGVQFSDGFATLRVPVESIFDGSVFNSMNMMLIQRINTIASRDDFEAKVIQHCALQFGNRIAALEAKMAEMEDRASFMGQRMNTCEEQVEEVKLGLRHQSDSLDDHEERITELRDDLEKAVEEAGALEREVGDVKEQVETNEREIDRIDGLVVDLRSEFSMLPQSDSKDVEQAIDQLAEDMRLTTENVTVLSKRVLDLEMSRVSVKEFFRELVKNFDAPIDDQSPLPAQVGDASTAPVDGDGIPTQWTPEKEWTTGNDAVNTDKE